MSAFNEERVLTVHHWTDKLFTFTTTRDPSMRFSNGHFTMIGLRVNDKPLLRADSIVSANYEEHREFLSIKVPDGPLTSRLQHIKVGDSIIVGRKPTVSGSEIGSAKKIFTRSDVLISRLRPYLRQVAIVDEGFVLNAGGAELACSTEFYVLRSRSSARIDFLVPYLLSTAVQKALAASQEGGHHPRFDESVLLGLPVPGAVLLQRELYTEAISIAAARYRESEALVQSHISKANIAMLL